MQYAIVDIETTGGHPSANAITEIAINIHDGENVVERYTTLINPGRPIPLYITALTGISDEMVANAPAFHDVASKVASLLSGKIFIAHNVNFDFSFIKHQLVLAGYELNCKKLCTVRLSRKLMPGHKSYSLGKLCVSLEIPIIGRHRAGGDADATTILFDRLLKQDADKVIDQMIKRASKEQALPPNVIRDEVLALPGSPGVYYFLDNKGKVIYVGKAINIKKRVLSHFSGHNPNKQRQEFLKNIFHIEATPCGTELMALILEASEIKRLWPENNRALKRYEHKYGLYEFMDQNGYLRLAIDKHNKNMQSVQNFNNLLDGYNFLNRLVETFGLCTRLCNLRRSKEACLPVEGLDICHACTNPGDVDGYNTRVERALDTLRMEQPNFLLVDNGRTFDEKSCLLIENGKFYGMGYLKDDQVNSLEGLKDHLQPYPSNNYILNLILHHADRYPGKLRPVG